MRVLSRGLTQFRFENEAADSCDLNPGFQPLSDFHLPICTTAQLHGLRLEAVLSTHEYRRFVPDRLNRDLRYSDFGLKAIGGHQCVNEQPRAPCSLRVFQRHTYGGGTCLLAE